MLYLDSANIEGIRQLANTGVFAGVTTNPTILKQSGLGFNDIEQLDSQFLELGLTQRFYQTVGRTVPEILATAERILALGNGVWVKIPAVGAGLEAAAKLRGEPLLLTAVYHPTQALLAEGLGVDWIAPYIGRMDDIANNGVESAALMAYALESSDIGILAASIRSVDVLFELMAVGITDFTISIELAQQLIHQTNAMDAWHAFEQDAAEMDSSTAPTRKDA
ncbi:transaldolase family protein [Stomatohabitans albus]|uniref:transaldolase family protein n=1 Tax=Stomatohabitans albus TaxID=3110766 RepID=UPI00300C21D9